MSSSRTQFVCNELYSYGTIVSNWPMTSLLFFSTGYVGMQLTSSTETKHNWHAIYCPSRSTSSSPSSTVAEYLTLRTHSRYWKKKALRVTRRSDSSSISRRLVTCVTAAAVENLLPFSATFRINVNHSFIIFQSVMTLSWRSNSMILDLTCDELSVWDI